MTEPDDDNCACGKGMITSGRCHGPGCTQTADGDFCSERCSVAWQAQFWRPELPPQPHPEHFGLVPPSPDRLHADERSPRFSDLAAFRDAMDRAIHSLAEVTQMPSNLVDPDDPTSADVPRSHAPVRVAWGDPVMPTSRLRLGALANVPPAVLAIGAGSFGSGSAFAKAAEVERLNDRLRQAFLDHADEALAEARRRAHTGFATYAQAVESMWSDPPEFASANAENPQVASHPDPARGWLSRTLDRLFGRTT